MFRFFFNFFIPPFVSGKRVVTIHDMAYIAHPETVRFRTKYMLKMNIKRTCERADHIITVSNFSKAEIIKYLSVPPEKISVVNPAYEPRIFNTDPEPDAKTILEKYKIPNKYLLYLGTLEPRKNLTRLILAYSELNKLKENLPPLVLAGGKGWLYEPIFETIEKENLHNKVIVTGYVTDTEAICLIKNAIAFLFPSLYEGFGMPPLEAMACGIPVLTSNCASMPEVVGDAAVLVDPFSIAEIRDGIEKILDDEELRLALKKRGLRQCQKFSWSISASKLRKIGLELVGEGNEKN